MDKIMYEDSVRNQRTAVMDQYERDQKDFVAVLHFASAALTESNDFEVLQEEMNWALNFRI